MQAGKRRSILWGLLSAVRESSAAQFLDAEALTLAVAIESLLHSEFSEVGRPSAAARASISALQGHIQSWNGPQRVKDRAIGALGQLSTSRAGDKMSALAGSGKITQAHLNAWGRLRNPTTHRYLSSGIPTAELVQLVQINEVLLYHLIFLTIGYRGPYMEFATPGWPTRSFTGHYRPNRRKVAA
jgi:hypothetical protein